MLEDLALKIEAANDAVVSKHVAKFFAANPQYVDMAIVLLTFEQMTQLECDFDAEQAEISYKLFADAGVTIKTKGVAKLWMRLYAQAVKNLFKKTRVKQIEQYYLEMRETLYN